MYFKAREWRGWINDFIREHYEDMAWTEMQAVVEQTIRQPISTATLWHYAKQLGLPMKPRVMPRRPVVEKVPEQKPPRVVALDGHANTLCWECRNAVPGPDAGCEWSRLFRPVPGWEAEERRARLGAYELQTSYRVHKCPKFEEG